MKIKAISLACFLAISVQHSTQVAAQSTAGAAPPTKYCLKRPNDPTIPVMKYRTSDQDGITILKTYNPDCAGKSCEVIVGDKITHSGASLVWEKQQGSREEFTNAEMVAVNAGRVEIAKASNARYSVYLLYQGSVNKIECKLRGGILVGKYPEDNSDKACHIYRFEVFPQSDANYIRPDDIKNTDWSSTTCNLELQPGSGQGGDPPP